MREKYLTRKILLSWSCLILVVFPARAQYEQYEDIVDAPDAPTITREEEGIICTIEGVVVEKEPGPAFGSKEVKIIFLLTEKPSAYFSYYDVEKKALIFDFYDTRIGSSIIEPIHEQPITNSSMELSQIDLNKDVSGLKPDLRDVVRVTLFTPYDFDYIVHEDYGVVTMSFKWSEKIERSYARKGRSVYWKFPLALGVLGGGAYLAYDRWLKPAPPPPPPDPVSGWPPTREGL